MSKCVGTLAGMVQTRRRVEDEGCLLESALRRCRLGEAASNQARKLMGDGQWRAFEVSEEVAPLVNLTAKRLFKSLWEKHNVYLEFVQYTVSRVEGGIEVVSIDGLAEVWPTKEVWWLEVKWTRWEVEQALQSWRDGWKKVGVFKRIAEKEDEWRLHASMAGWMGRIPRVAFR